MEKIKQQIEKLLVFNSTSLSDISDEFHSIKNRINQGLEKMGENDLFTTKEIAEIKSFAMGRLDVKFYEHKQNILNKSREEFIF